MKCLHPEFLALEDTLWTRYLRAGHRITTTVPERWIAFLEDWNVERVLTISNEGEEMQHLVHIEPRVTGGSA